MIVVAGYTHIDASRRADALAAAKPYIDAARKRGGCNAYSWTPCPDDPARVYVFEEWDDEAALAAHLAGDTYATMLGHLSQFDVRDAEVKKYRVDLAEPVYDPEGVARADFFTDPKAGDAG
ncbi:MAG: antibiotic biosynthesis monooxygenase [Pseudomonadota bacterium]